MCFECDSVWDSIADDENFDSTDFETLMKENGIVPNWGKITKLHRILPTPPEASSHGTY
jgi:hypothetical protein